MQILFRFHKGEKNERIPTWFLFVEERLPVLCPVSHILAKALSEKVIAVGELDCVDSFFTTKLANQRGMKIRWKPEFRHKPVCRQTEPSLHGGQKSDNPLSRTIFDHHSRRLGKEAGLEEQLTLYCYRRGFAEAVDSKCLPAPQSDIYI